jgi:hypothetical protein
MGGKGGGLQHKWKGLIKMHHGEIRIEDVCLIHFAQSAVHLPSHEKTILRFLSRWELPWPATY